MKLKEIPRTATFAWLPDASPQLVTGNAAGTIDADFSATMALELWKLDLLDHSVAGFTAESVGRVETDARFHDLAVSEDGRFAAGALENGVVDVWEIPSLAKAGHNATAHSGAVRSVGWSRKDVTKFATGGTSGQVFVWDVNALDKPFAPGDAATARHDDVSSVAWNANAAQILATAGASGFTSIWDDRRRREHMHFHYTNGAGVRVPVSCVQWHPTSSTNLLTCSADDSEPVICLWDLRNVNSPEKVLRGGHTKGVLTADWCRQDPALLLSGGRDNQTILWNPEAGEALGAYPISVEWNFKTQFHPRMPDLFAGASFDGKVTIQTLQDTHSGAAHAASSAAAGKAGDDFWDSDTVMDAVHPSFQLQQAPKWLKRPVSAVFGFGGKLAVVENNTVFVRSGKGSAPEADLSAELGESLKAKDFEAIASASESEGGWELLTAVASGKDVPLPEEALPAPSDDDEDFNIVPQYAPEGELPLLEAATASITRAILKGDFDGAVTKLVADNKPDDALLIASFGGPDLVKRAQNAYLSAHAAKRPYLRAAWGIAGEHLNDLAEHSELAAWPSVVRALDTSPDAITALGSRLAAAGERDNALRVFLAGKNVAAAAGLWLDEQPALEAQISKENKATKYVAHVLALQQVVKKLAVATGKLGLPPANVVGADRLYSAFRDYANIASQQGDLELAKLFLDMLPDEYSADKQRVDVATQQSPLKTSSRPTATGPRGYAGSSGQSVPAPLAPQSPGRATASPSNAPASPVPPFSNGLRAQPAAPKATGRRYVANPYAVQPPTPPSGPGSAPPPPMVGASQTAVASTPVAPPPRAGAKIGWNDVPELPESKPLRRPPAAHVAAPPRAAPQSGPPSRVSLSPRGSQSTVAPPPPAGASKTTRPPPSLGGPAPAAAGASVAAPGEPPVSPPPPVAARPNPYAPKSSVRATSSAKPNPYAPSPGSTPRASSSPSPAPQLSQAGPRPGPPPRARHVAPPPTAAVASLMTSTPPPAAVANAAVVPPPPVAAASPVASSAAAPAAAPIAAPPRVSASPAGADKKGRIPVDAQPIYSTFSAEMQRIRPVIESQYPKQYNDTARRLDILYEKLGNQELAPETVEKLHSLAGNLSDAKYEEANAIVVEIISTETGEWITGIKRLAQMAKAVPV